MTPAYEKARKHLDAGDLLILDGGVSTELQRRGISMQDDLWSGRAVLDAWEGVVDMHRAYIDAGATVITANTYASSRLMLEPAGLGDRVEQINRLAVDAALEARERAGTPDLLVAASMSHMVPIPAGGYRVDPGARPGRQVMQQAFAELAALHTAAGADVLLLEMMSARQAMGAMFDALADAALPVWCGQSAVAGVDGRLRSWHEPEVAYREIVAVAAQHDFEALGIMHTRADLVDEALPVIRSHYAGPIMAYPDSGYLQMPDWRFGETIAPARFARFAEGWRGAGAQIIGGCCGLGPEHIAAIADLK
jgi:homocysteine S-methyltransferase